MGLLSGLTNFLFGDPGEGYRKAAEQYQQYYTPYAQMGQEQMGRLAGMSEQLSHPNQFLANLMQGYETSPYAKQLQSEAQSQGMDAASAMGLGGSSAALQNIQRGASDIMQKDRANYLQNLMNTYLSGAGIAQNMFGTGAQMAGRLGEGMGSAAFGEQVSPGQQAMGFGGLLAGLMGGNYGQNNFAPTRAGNRFY